LVLIIAKDTGCTFSQGLLPDTYLARMDLKPAGQVGGCLFALERFQGFSLSLPNGYPGFIMMGCVSFGSVSCPAPPVLSLF